MICKVWLQEEINTMKDVANVTSTYLWAFPRVSPSYRSILELHGRGKFLATLDGNQILLMYKAQAPGDRDGHYRIHCECSQSRVT